ncbi:unnamed protein product [Prunus brigantina]
MRLAPASISDNSILAFEIMHFMHRKIKWRKGVMTLKLNMSKVYDWVEWSFLKNVMGAMDFEYKCVQLIMMCVSSVSYSFLVNGAPIGYVLPHRGLRQGNPLSSYLFLLCAEIFSSLITQAENQGLIHRFSICRGTPAVSHLLSLTKVFSSRRRPI